MIERHPGGDDLAAYALGALEADEAAAVAVHVQDCPVCREELAVHQETVGALPLAAPALAAPRSLRRRVLQEVAADARARHTPHRVRRPFPLVPSLAAVAVAAVAAVIVLAVSHTGAPAQRVIRAEVAGAGAAELRIAGGHAELVVRGLPAPPAGKIYEVWLQRPGRAPAPTTALFGVTRSGTGDVAVPGSLRGVARVMVTPEPLGGSQQPTHAPVITAALT